MNNFDFEYRGNLHIHSLYSDGAGTIPEIAASAQRMGLDFILLNDHCHMTDALHLDEEGLYGNVLVLLGVEVGERYHHYLAYDVRERPAPSVEGPQAVIDSVNAQGGFGFLAHPFEKGMPFKENSIAYTWDDLSVHGYTGICIWNFTSRWKERVKNALSGLFHVLSKTYSLKGPSQETLSFWDALCQQRRVVAIGGSDAHATVFKWGALGIKPLSYDYLLNSIDVHILLDKELSGEFAKAKTEVYEALRQGRVFIANENLAPARGFRFYYISGNGARLTQGQERTFQPGHMVVESPLNSEIRLLRDGARVGLWRGRKGTFSVNKKGVYRSEVFWHHPIFGWRPWIFSNPIYLR